MRLKRFKSIAAIISEDIIYIILIQCITKCFEFYEIEIIYTELLTFSLINHNQETFLPLSLLILKGNKLYVT